MATRPVGFPPERAERASPPPVPADRKSPGAILDMEPATQIPNQQVPDDTPAIDLNDRATQGGRGHWLNPRNGKAKP